MLDTSLMRGVTIDARTRSARAQPGCLLGDLDRETQLHGRTRAAYGGNYARLTTVKAKWDPKNVFHMNRNIRAGEVEVPPPAS